MKRHAGYTLIELVVAMTIIGILAAIAIPNILGWIQNRHFTSSIQQAVSILNSTRIHAVKENRNAGVVFDADNGRITSFAGIRDDEDWKVDEARRIHEYEMPAGVAIKKVTFDGGRLGFDGRGMLIDNNVGSVEIASDRGLSINLSVNLTGRIRMDDNVGEENTE